MQLFVLRYQPCEGRHDGGRKEARINIKSRAAELFAPKRVGRVRKLESRQMPGVYHLYPKECGKLEARLAHRKPVA